MRIYRFGRFRIDVQARELRRDDELLQISPKVFDCIVYLITNRERAVGRDELVAAVWGNVDIAEVQLRHLVRKVRHTVGATTDQEDPIRTVPRFGYRWVATILSENSGTFEEAASSVLSASSSVPPAAVKRVWIRHVGIGVAILVVVGTLVWKGPFFRDSHTRAAPPQIVHPVQPLAAVLPVQTFRIDEDTAWMRLGLMDLMADHLRGAGLIVVPSENVVALDQATPTNSLAAKVRQASGARYVIVPRVARQQDQWRVDVELGRPDGSSTELEARSPEVITAVDDICDRLLTELGVHPNSTKLDPSAAEFSRLRQRVESAVLAGNIASAQRILDAASDALKSRTQLQLLRAKIDLQAGAAKQVDERLGALLQTIPSEIDASLRAEILNEMGAAERQTGQWDLATQRFDESIRLLEKTNQPLVLGRAYVGRGSVEALLGRYDDAQSDFSRAQVAFELAGDALDVARAEMNEGALEEMRGHPSQGLALLTHAAEGLKRFNDHAWLVNALGNIISADLDLLQPADAAAVAERMNRELPEMGSSVHARIARLQYVPALLRTGRLREAGELIAALRHDEEARNEPIFLGMASFYEAELAYRKHEVSSALSAARRAKDALNEREYDDERSAAWLLETRALRVLGDNAEAAAEVRKLAAWANKRESERPLLRAHLAEAEQAWAEGRLDAASELYDIALHAAHERGIPAEIAEVVLSYGDALIRGGDLEQAATIVGQITAWADRDFDCAVMRARLYRALDHRLAWQSSLDRARALAAQREIPANLAEPLKAANSLANSR